MQQHRVAPFSPMTDPRVYYPVASHKALWRVLRSALRREEGVVVITGPPGVGKTLILLRLRQIFPEDREMRHLPDADADAALFLRTLLQIFGAELKEGQSYSHRELLLSMELWATQGKRLLVVVDRAECLNVANLEVLHHVASFQMDGRHPCQVLLAGRLETSTMAMDPRYAALQPLLVGTATLGPLNAEEIMGYVRFHLDREGMEGWTLTQGGWRALRGASGGIPRQINRIMAEVLVRMDGRQTARIGGFAIRRAAAGSHAKYRVMQRQQLPRLARTEWINTRLRQEQGTRRSHQLYVMLDRWLVRLAGLGVLVAMAGLVFRVTYQIPENSVITTLEQTYSPSEESYPSDEFSQPGVRHQARQPVFVQTTATRSRDTATTIMSGLFRKGYRAYLQQSEDADGVALFAVRIKYPDRVAAEQVAERLLRLEGLATEIVEENASE
ncbi:MAG: AAA family ATPase [Magnetococcus sp. DMHC-1]|nr:AAA family ATPase [Magnetococcales bacterium]